MLSLFTTSNVRRPHWRQRGDTIVEVMIVLAVLGFAFAISFATANHSLILARNAEEHSEALQFLQSQVEQLRDYLSQSSQPGSFTAPAWGTVPNIYSSQFCFVGASQIVDSTATPPAGVNPPCDVGNETVNNLPLYSVYLKYSCDSSIGACLPAPTTPESNSYFTATINWPGLGELGPQQEQLSYRVY